MKFQNPSFKFFLDGRTNGHKRTNGQTNKQTNKRTRRKQYAPHFFKVGGIKRKIMNYKKVVDLSHFMFVHHIFSSVSVAEWPPFGK